MSKNSFATLTRTRQHIFAPCSGCDIITITMRDILQHAIDRCSNLTFDDVYNSVNPPLIEYSDDLADLMAVATGRTNTEAFKDEVFAAVEVLNESRPDRTDVPIVVVDIVYDADDPADLAGLPDTLSFVVDRETLGELYEGNEDILADMISDATGFCIHSFDWAEASA